MNLAILLLVVLFSTSCFFFGRKKIIKITSENKIRPNALPDYYGYYLIQDYNYNSKNENGIIIISL